MCHSFIQVHSMQSTPILCTCCETKYVSGPHKQLHLFPRGLATGCHDNLASWWWWLTFIYADYKCPYIKIKLHFAKSCVKQLLRSNDTASIVAHDTLSFAGGATTKGCRGSQQSATACFHCYKFTNFSCEGIHQCTVCGFMWCSLLTLSFSGVSVRGQLQMHLFVCFIMAGCLNIGPYS